MREILPKVNWNQLASMYVEGRSGEECEAQWKKTLHLMRQRVGRWTPDEDKRLTVAAILFGPKNWKKIAQFGPGRTQVQCRGRWVNSWDPSVNRGEWTEEEDLMLEAALEEHGFSWSKVAAALPGRIDNQCWSSC
ncbi:transcription factor MYB3R-3-like [Pistacia vera]|uniref:transcription factor MYB3R-3-like n=1 Tax=Pistacia vera TaxID=55513 RepID=UPI001262B454|nr:transcription factor MYB3R-3-like [Pistacia vera]